MISKARLWMGILYPDNMIEDWKDRIGDILQLPYAYAIHDKDKNKDGSIAKVHVHLMVAWSNTTTQGHALNVMKELSQEGKNCISTCKAVIGAKSAYDYLIHDTDDCKRKGKYLYPENARVLGNNFDIHFYEQISVEDKRDMARELCELIIERRITNFEDFYILSMAEHSDNVNYFEIIKTHSGLFERLIKGVWLKDGQKQDVFKR